MPTRSSNNRNTAKPPNPTRYHFVPAYSQRVGVDQCAARASKRSSHAMTGDYSTVGVQKWP